MKRRLFLMGGLAGLGACAVSQAVVGPEGQLAMLMPGIDLTPATLRREWVLDGLPQDTLALPQGPVGIITRQNRTALRVVGASNSFVLARRTQAWLLATPYLQFAWNLDPFEGRYHPIGLMIGFHGGRPESGSWGSQPLAWTGKVLPPHDRLLILRWGHSALERGDLTPAVGTSYYTLRGGAENAGLWWDESVDLDNLYRRAWPHDDFGRVRIMFLGVTAIGGSPGLGGHFAGFALFR